MNARVFTLSQLDETILWLCAKHPPQTRSGIARILRRKESNVTVSMNRLCHFGYIDHGRGSCVPTPKALNHVSTLNPDEMRQLVRPEPVRAGARGMATFTFSADGERPPPAMEPRGSIEPPLQHLVDALQSQQDQLLRAANAKLCARVVELEAENAELRKKLQTARERVGFAMTAL